MVDPGGDKIVRNGAGVLCCIAMIKSPLLIEIVDKVRSEIPKGRLVRGFFGAIDNPTPPNVIPDSVRLQTEEEVEAFYDITASKPIWLQVILYRDPAANPLVPDSPPPDDEPSFPKDFIDAPAYYIDPTTDSDTRLETRPGKLKEHS